MKTALTALALTLALASTTLAQGQSPPASPGRLTLPPIPSRSLPSAQPPGQGKADASVTRTGLAPRDETKPQPMAPSLAGAADTTAADQPPAGLPTEPLEPYLLTTNQGPWMIHAYSFRGPWASRHAQALTIELRQMGWPAYVFPSRIQPGGSNIRNIPPTAPEYIKRGDLTPPESYRSYDEAAVLVGNFASIDDASKNLGKVKGLSPQHIDGPNSIWKAADPRASRLGLKRATVTQNPLVAAQRLYPNTKDVVVKPGMTLDPFIMNASVVAPKPDTFVKQMNEGDRSLLKCPGNFTLIVAEYGGRTTFNPADPRFKDDRYLKNSPLQTAHEDAEALADALAKSDLLKKAGHKVYVYHDRATSKVCVGSFQDEKDPAAQAVRELIMNQINLFKSKDGNISLAKMELESGAAQPKGLSGKLDIAEMAKLRFKSSSVAKYDQKNGEFLNLTPWASLMPVPRG